jgi:hypothetical protein
VNPRVKPLTRRIVLRTKKKPGMAVMRINDRRGFLVDHSNPNATTRTVGTYKAVGEPLRGGPFNFYTAEWFRLYVAFINFVCFPIPVLHLSPPRISRQSAVHSKICAPVRSFKSGHETPRIALFSRITSTNAHNSTMIVVIAMRFYGDRS